MSTNTSQCSTHVNGSIVDGDHFRLLVQALAIPLPLAHQPLRLLVTGSREYHDRQAVVAVLLGLAQTHGPLFVLDGECPKGGLDQLAHDFAVEQGWPWKRMPAKWKLYGRRAGPIRNQEMVDTHPDLCIGWPDTDSAGTYNCMDKAVKAGIPTYYLPPLTWAVLPYRKERR